VSAVAGDFGRRDLSGAVDIPLMNDKALFRMAGMIHDTAGYEVDLATGKHYADQHYFVLRPSLILRIGESVENYTMFQYYHDRDNGYLPILQNYNTNNALIARFGPNSYFDHLVARNKAGGGDLGPYTVDGAVVGQGFSGFEETQSFIVNRTTWNVTGELAVTNIFSYRSDGALFRPDGQNYHDLFGEPSNDPRVIATVDGPLPTDKMWSDEVKASGALFDNVFRYTGGFFYRGYTQGTEITWVNQLGALSANLVDGNPSVPNRTRAVYGQTETDLSNIVQNLTFTAGYRYTWDKVALSRTDYTGLFDSSGAPVPISQLGQVHHFAAQDFSGNNWLVGLRYQYSPDTMVYVTGSKGYRAGQVNPILPIQFQVVQPETLKQIEGGIKSSFALGGVEMRTNVAAYYGWYSDIQVSVTGLHQIAPPPAPPQSFTIAENAAAGLLRGIDAGITVLPTKWLEFGINGSYNANKYTKWPVFSPIDGTTVIGDRSNTPFQGTPKWAYDLDATIHLPMDDNWGKLSVGVDYQYRSPVWFDASLPYGKNTPFTNQTAANGYGPYTTAFGPTAVQADREFAADELNLSLTWSDLAGRQGLTGTINVTNVTNALNFYAGGYGFHTLGITQGVPDAPRMFSVELRYAF